MDNFRDFMVGVDVGGTFTDVVAVNEAGLWRGKVPTVHGDVGRGVIDGLTTAAAQAGLELSALLERVEWFGLGTTAVTNVVAEMRGRRVGLLTTAGLEDELILARGIRFSVDGTVVGPPPIVPRQAIAGVNERIDCNGAVLNPLDPAAAVSAVQRIRDANEIDCIVISFVNAYRNPEHERQAGEAVRAVFPGLHVSVATELTHVFGFLPRTMFAVLNAYAGVVLEGVDELAAELRSGGMAAKLRLVNATGGVIGIDAARGQPLILMHSGPAAGVAAACSIGTLSGRKRLLACDMGGTSYDISVIEDGQPRRRINAEILRVPTGLSMVDVDSIGSGGGSIGWADARGMLRVGPRSAGSRPGPACYGWGGTAPTVTDALVVLGYIDAAHFLGGRMKLDAGAAHMACARLGIELGLTASETAWGIRRIALADMTRAVRLILNRRGLDAADYAIISYGGCGGLFNVDVARALGVETVIIPSFASVLSAYGAATAPIKRERARAVMAQFPLDEAMLDDHITALRREVLDDLAGDQIDAADATISFEAAIRFKRQPSELVIPARLELPQKEMAAALVDDFRDEYCRLYGAGSIMLGAPMELVMLRAIGTGRANLPRRVTPDAAIAGYVQQGARRREIRLEADLPACPVMVFDGDELFPGMVLHGPAGIDGVDTTIWIPRGASAVVGEDLSLEVTATATAAAAAAPLEAAELDNMPAAVMLELLRSQLQSIADAAVETVIRTAISPVINEAKDCGAVMVDAGGRIITGGGMGTIHWLAGQRAIQATIARFGGDIGVGDVFIANDPYNGGGMHPADIVIQRPIFHNDKCIAWVAFSAHMMDMGGMSVGSWSPGATECFQEAFRIPPVRLIKAGMDAQEIWDILRTNIRFFTLVEMDVRCLIAGTHAADAGLRAVIAQNGHAAFERGVDQLIALSERELRKAIVKIADGEYRSTGWTEWRDQFLRLPCRLRVEGDTLKFDFEGADPQVPFFINSQPYIIKTFFVPSLMAALVPELPFNEGILRPIDLYCPAGTITHAISPAPINAGHIHVGGIAAEMMFRCLRLAIWASPGLSDVVPAMGAEGYAALATNAWYGVAANGVGETWMVMDGILTGGCAFRGSDGTDFAMKSIDLPNRELSQPGTFDVETYETWFPMLMRERRVLSGIYGAGRWRAGAALAHSFEPRGAPSLLGQMIGTRGRLPLNGEAGGAPGAVTHFRVRGAQGGVRPVAMAGADIIVQAGERFETTSGSAGGWGDPLDRSPDAVLSDILDGRISSAEANLCYGVVTVGQECDSAATNRLRAAMRLQRLAKAIPPAARPHGGDLTGPAQPLYPGIIHRQGWAVAEASGAVLARAPAHWTDGCAVLEDTTEGVLRRSYLDPVTGAVLLSEAVPEGYGRAFQTLPTHWVRDVALAAE